MIEKAMPPNIVLRFDTSTGSVDLLATTDWLRGSRGCEGTAAGSYGLGLAGPLACQMDAARWWMWQV